MLGQLEEAETCFRRAIECDPAGCPAHGQFGWGFRAGAGGRSALSAGAGNQSKPTQRAGDSWHDFSDQGRYHETSACFEHPDALEYPGWFNVCCSAMFVSHFVEESRPGECLDKARKVGLRLSKSARKRFSAWKLNPAPARLRVGLVTGDLKNHPVGYFLEGLLASLAESSVDVMAYSTTLYEDDLTQRIRPWFSNWRNIALLDDAEAARQIHGDGVHVLLDLSGYTEGYAAAGVCLEARTGAGVLAGVFRDYGLAGDGLFFGR